MNLIHSAMRQCHGNHPKGVGPGGRRHYRCTCVISHSLEKEGDLMLQLCAEETNEMPIQQISCRSNPRCKTEKVHPTELQVDILTAFGLQHYIQYSNLGVKGKYSRGNTLLFFHTCDLTCSLCSSLLEST